MLLKKIAVILTLGTALLGSGCATVNTTEIKDEFKKAFIPAPTQQTKVTSNPNAICYDFVVRALGGVWLKSLVVVNGQDIGYKEAARFLGEADYISHEYDFEVYKGQQCTSLQKTYDPKRIFIYSK